MCRFKSRTGCLQAWIQNASLRDNVLFGDAFDQDRYDEVYPRACLAVTQMLTDCCTTNCTGCSCLLFVERSGAAPCRRRDRDWRARHQHQWWTEAAGSNGSRCLCKQRCMLAENWSSCALCDHAVPRSCLSRRWWLAHCMCACTHCTYLSHALCRSMCSTMS
jgi:hypothetical protein